MNKITASNKKVPAVVLGLALNGLGLVRSLGRQKIPVYALDYIVDTEGLYSKYAQSYVCPNPETQPEKLMKYLKMLSRKTDSKPVLFPASDSFVLFVSNNLSELSKDFKIVISNPQVQADLVSKSKLNEIAKRFGVPCPQTFSVNSFDELNQVVDDITYPCLIKPALSPSWRKPEMKPVVGPRKVIKVDTAAKLVEWYRKIMLHDPRVVIQELIPGDDAHLFYVASYLDRDSRVLGAFAGRKTRVTPIHFGSASFVEAVYNPTLLELNKKLLTSIGYRGLGGVEFKLDPRDGKFKLIEVNARWGLWDGFGSYCGINLSQIAYLDAIGQKVSPVSTYSSDKKWISFEREIFAFLQYRREGSLTLKEWISTLSFRMMHACFAVDDLGPSLNVIRRLYARYSSVGGLKQYFIWRQTPSDTGVDTAEEMKS